ncbi:hypothetical protein BV22DRAFT_1024425, partial [Leucogyrophana mollusca]
MQGRKRCLRARFSDQNHPQYHTHRLRQRGKPIVPVLLCDSFPRPDRTSEEREQFCRAALLLFKPWRQYSELKGVHASYTQAYDNWDFPDHAKRVIHNLNIENECKDARDTYTD